MSKVSTTAERIKQYMYSKGLTQSELIEIVKPYSEELGVKFNSAYLSQVLKEKFEPSQEKIYLLSVALKVDPAYLMGWDIDESPASTASKPIPNACTARSELSPDEEQLLTTYRNLSPSGKNYLKEQLSIASTIFLKNTQDQAENIG